MRWRRSEPYLAGPRAGGGGGGGAALPLSDTDTFSHNGATSPRGGHLPGPGAAWLARPNNISRSSVEDAVADWPNTNTRRSSDLCPIGGFPGKAVQVDPIKPMLKLPGTKRLKLEYGKLLSEFAFNFNLRCYTPAARCCTTHSPPPAVRTG